MPSTLSVKEISALKTKDNELEMEIKYLFNKLIYKSVNFLKSLLKLSRKKLEVKVPTFQVVKNKELLLREPSFENQ